MSIKREYRLLGVIVMEITVVLLVHWALLQWVARQQVVASLLAAGEHVPRFTLSLAIIFIMVRFLAIFLLPGVAFSRLTQLAFYIFVEKPRELADNERRLSAEANPPAV
jgi:hypothetical protein